MAITELQRTKRQQTLGASDMATILGFNPWKNSVDLWLEKTGRVEPEEAGEAAEIGDALEAGIRPLAERRIGCKLVKPTGTFMHENGVMSANVDLMLNKAQRGSAICEIKTTGRADEWENDQIPSRVLVQVAAQMACAGSSQAHIAALVARFGLSVEMRLVERNQEVAELIEAIETRACEWWRKHIEGDTPPKGVASLDYLSKRVRAAGKVVKLPVVLVTQYQAAKDAAKAAEEAADAAKAALVQALGDGDAGEAEDGSVVKYTNVVTTRLDSTALKAAHPALFAEFSKDSAYRRLTVKAAKGGV